jgi:hypothetical protein
MPVPKAVERDTGLANTLLQDSKRNATMAEYFAKAVGAHRQLFASGYVNPVPEWNAPEVIAQSSPARKEGHALEEHSV